MDEFPWFLLLSLFLSSMQRTSCKGFSTNTSFHLVLPLQSKAAMPSPNPSSNKLSFHHNISLTVSLAVGSPPQQVTMVLDTGSELSWLRCNSSSFNPHLSSSYYQNPCSSSTCTVKTADFTDPVSCDTNKLCHVTLSYADGSSVEGTLAYERFHLGDTQMNLELVFGCIDSVSSSNSDEDLKSNGLIGLNRGKLSFVSQMGIPQFSYCISGTDSSGMLLLGKTELPWKMKLNYTPLVQIPIHLPYFNRVAYTVHLQEIRVSDTILPIPSSILEPDHTGAGQTMVDSGTQFTFLLGPVYTALKTEFLKQTKGILHPINDSNFVFQGAMDLCFRDKGFIPPLPTVHLILRGAEISVSDEKLLYKVPGGGGGALCFTFGNSDLLGVESYVIGHHHQQNFWVEFDLQRSRLGLAEFRCDSASQKLGLSQSNHP